MADKGTHRTTLDLDVRSYDRARELLGTRGYRDTVNEALKAVDRAHRLQRGAELIRAGGLNLSSPEDVEEMRRKRA